jgi:hypothetical protein
MKNIPGINKHLVKSLIFKYIEGALIRPAGKDPAMWV